MAPEIVGEVDDLLSMLRGGREGLSEYVLRPLFIRAWRYLSVNRVPETCRNGCDQYTMKGDKTIYAPAADGAELC